MKMLLNCRFSMTMWMLMGISCVAASAQRYGGLDPALVASAVSQWAYLLKVTSCAHACMEAWMHRNRQAGAT